MTHSSLISCHPLLPQFKPMPASAKAAPASVAPASTGSAFQPLRRTGAQPQIVATTAATLQEQLEEAAAEEDDVYDENRHPSAASRSSATAAVSGTAGAKKIVIRPEDAGKNECVTQ